MSLASVQEIIRRKWTDLPMPNEVIDFVHSLPAAIPVGLSFPTAMVNLSLMMMRPLAVIIKPTSPVTLMIMAMNIPTKIMNMVATPHPLFATMPSQDCMTTTMIMH